MPESGDELDYEYTGSDRRKHTEDIKEVKKLLHKLTEDFNEHIKEETKHQPSIDELIELLAAVKILLKSFKWLISFAVGAYALLLWVKEHVKI